MKAVRFYLNYTDVSHKLQVFRSRKQADSSMHAYTMSQLARSMQRNTAQSVPSTPSAQS